MQTQGSNNKHSFCIKKTKLRDLKLALPCDDMIEPKKNNKKDKIKKFGSKNKAILGNKMNKPWPLELILMSLPRKSSMLNALTIIKSATMLTTAPYFQKIAFVLATSMLIIDSDNEKIVFKTMPCINHPI